MKLNVSPSMVLLAAAAVPVAYLSYRLTKGVKAAADTTEQTVTTLGNYLYSSAEAANPANDKNVVNQSASYWVQKLSGGKYLSVGDWLYGVTHGGQ